MIGWKFVHHTGWITKDKQMAETADSEYVYECPKCEHQVHIKSQPIRREPGIVGYALSIPSAIQCPKCELNKKVGIKES